MLDQALSRIGVDQLLHQGVDGRVLQADEVAAAGIVGGGALPELALLVTRGVGLRVAADDHVEIPRAQAVDVLRDIDPADHQVDTQVRQVALERQQDALEFGLRQEEFNGHRLALGVDHLVVDNAPASLLQQLVGLALLFADHAAAIGNRVGKGAGEHRVGDLAAQRFENLQLGGVGQVAGGHVGVLEVAAGAGVGTVEQLLVGPFEVQQQAQCFTYPYILEQRAANVVDKALHAGRVAVGQLFEDQAFLPHSRHVIGGGPALRCGFQAVVELAGLERFEGDCAVAVVVGGHLVEVVETTVDRQVLAPVVLDPLVADRAPRLDLGDLVRAAAQGDFQVALGELAAFPEVLGQYRQLAEDQRKFAVVAVLELEQHPLRVFGDHFGDIGVVAAVQRCAVLDQGVEGEHHVFGVHRVAVMKTRFGAQVEAHPAVVRGFFDLAGDQAVLGERFIQALGHQGVVDQANVVGGYALVDERVEAVETAEAGLAKGAALGRVGVDVVEVLEAGRVFRRFVVEGQGVLRCSQCLAAKAGQQQCAGLQAQAGHWHHWAFSEGFIHQLLSPRV
ncbi:hypothetical protein D3C81_1016960 [compost metagenome]